MDGFLGWLRGLCASSDEHLLIKNKGLTSIDRDNVNWTMQTWTFWTVSHSQFRLPGSWTQPNLVKADSRHVLLWSTRITLPLVVFVV